MEQKAVSMGVQNCDQLNWHDFRYTVVYTLIASLVQIQISVTLTNTMGFPIDKKGFYDLSIYRWEKYLAQ